MRRFFSVFTGLAVLGLMTGGSAHADDAEWEESSPYYEDDAWYDVTEWFDGNDYNPINEFSGDEDSDWATGYGYDERNQNDNWFYDYYDDNYTSTNHRDRSARNTTARNDNPRNQRDSQRSSYSYGYWDLDGDGLYDESYFLSDANNDGTYVGYHTVYNTTDKASEKDRAKRDDQRQARRDATGKSGQFKEVMGTIESTKEVKVKDTTRLVAHVKSSGGETCVVDLGKQKDLKQDQLKEGAKIEAKGPAAHVGEKQVVLAQSVSIDGKRQQIDRTRGSFSGEIVSTKKVNVRDREHLLAMVKKGDKKRAIDLGQAKNLNELNLEKGQELTVTGPPVKIKDRIIFMAQQVKQNGKTHEIDRAPTNRQSQNQNRKNSKRDSKTKS